jgi:hypothetical protein
MSFDVIQAGRQVAPKLRAVPRAASTRKPLTPTQRVLALQRAAGNRAVQSLLGNRPFTTQRSADPSAPAELEAERAAEQVTVPTTTPLLDPGGARPPWSPNAEGLPDDVRAEMEGAFDTDLGPLRVHTDAAAGERADRYGAKAVTDGNDVYLGEKSRDVRAPDNKRTLAHEIAHAVQQGLPAGIRGAGAGLTPAARRPMAAPTVTAVNTPATAEVGAGGRGIGVTAVAAGAAPLTWTLVGGPAGVNIVPTGRRTARITATAAAAAGAGGNFQAQAALTATPGDNAVSGNILLVGITSVTITAQPAFSAGIATAVGAAVPPANSLDPNRGGVTGNSGTLTIVTAPGGRATTTTLVPTRGITVAGTALTPGTETGTVALRVTDTATGAPRNLNVVINPVPTRVAGMTNGGGAGATNYGQINNISFTPTHGAAAALTRVVGETIGAAGRDDMNLVPTLNGTGPNPVPNLGQSAPANNWPDNVFTGRASIDVNQFVGPGAPGLPAISDNRQGMHFLGWTGNPPWSNEFANGIQRVMLLAQGNGFIVRTDQRFGGVSAPPRIEPYAAPSPPLIRFTNIVATPNAPAARGLAADGVAQAGIAFVSTTPARPVNLTLLNGSMAFTTVIAGAPAAGPHTVQAGLVPMTARIRIADATFANRRAEQNIGIVPVNVRFVGGILDVPAGTPAAALNLSAAPGGRTLVPTVTTPGFVAVQVAPAVPANAARQVTVTRPGPGPATVSVTIADSVLAAKSVTVRIRFR